MVMPILRAVIARALVSSGMLPTLGITIINITPIA